MGRSLRRLRRRGFSLVELLMVLIIGGMVMGAVFLLMTSFMGSYDNTKGYTEALQSAEMACTYVEPYVLMAGMALPWSRDTYQTTFQPFRPAFYALWDGPLSVDTTTPGSPRLRVAAVFPGGTKATSADVVTSTPSAVSLNKALSALNVGTPVIFPRSTAATTNPCLITGNAAAPDYQMRAQSDTVIDTMGELHFLQPAEFYVATPPGQVPHLRMVSLGGDQPVVSHIAAWRVSVDLPLVRVTILARASEPTLLAKEGSDVPNWGPAPDPRYRYVALTRAWKVRNWRGEIR